MLAPLTGPTKHNKNNAFFQISILLYKANIKKLLKK